MTDPTHDNATAGLVAWLRARDNSTWHQTCVKYRQIADALEAATARADKAEARVAELSAALHDEAILHEATAQQRDRAYVKLDAALSRVTEAKAEGFRECQDKAADLARRYLYCTKGRAEQAIRALAQSGGADPAQGGRDDG